MQTNKNVILEIDPKIMEYIKTLLQIELIILKARFFPEIE